jgi:uncharacterized protein YndB with AHSA1/START domain
MSSSKSIATTLLSINAKTDKVWDALTNSSIVKQYFFGTDLVTTWKPEDPIYFRGTWENTPYEDKGIVKTFIPNKSLSYTYKSSWDPLPDLPENYLLIQYELFDKGNFTEVKITQESHDEEKAKHSEENWKTVLNEMKKLLEI